jgi:hypothetical protein
MARNVGQECAGAHVTDLDASEQADNDDDRLLDEAAA